MSRVPRSPSSAAALRRNAILASACVLGLTAAALAEVKLAIAPDTVDGVYEPGKTVTWTVTAKDGDKPAAGKIAWSLRKGGLTEIDKGSADLADGTAKITAKRDDPGVLLLQVSLPLDNPTKDAKTGKAAKAVTGLGAAVFAPGKIAPSAPEPDDFDAFWKEKIAELHAVPINVQITPVDVGDKTVEYYKVTMDNIRGGKIHGQLAKPAGKTDLPAILQVQWAGVYPLNREWVLGHARGGWLAFNIIAHDLPIDEKPEFYAAKAKKELDDYPGQGNDDREKAYFLRMFLSCRRAVDYLTERPDWNKKTVVVHGGSQGGYQAIVTAGIHPAVTAFAANVPAGCDHTGKAAGRSPGWPNWAGRTWQGKDEKRMLDTARYFDAMNFAARAKCPAIVGIGLIDTVCPAEGVFATVNRLKGPTKLVIMPQAGHGGDHKAYNSVLWKFFEENKLPKTRE